MTDEIQDTGDLTPLPVPADVSDVEDTQPDTEREEDQ